MQIEQSASLAPNIDQYLGVWAMADNQFQSLYQLAMGMDVHLHLQSGAPAKAAAHARASMAAERKGKIAIVRLSGTLMKEEASFTKSTSTVAARRAIRQAAADDGVSSILLYIDSPGGTAAGTKELADDVAAANERKPVWSYIEDLGASAAYWVASQAEKVIANATGLVGSIGTYGVVYDMSGRAAQQGIKVHVVRAGKHKGDFTPGTEVTSEQLADYQRIIDQLNDHFVQGVSKGRRLSEQRVRELADGRVHVGPAAVELNLIDAVKSLDDTLAQMANLLPRRSKMDASNAMGSSIDLHLNGGENAASTSTTTTTTTAPTAQQPAGPKPASMAELRAACPKASADFLVDQATKGATIEQAKDAYIAHLESQPKPTVAKPGVQGVNAGGVTTADAESSGGDAIETFNNLVTEKMNGGKVERSAAVIAAAKANPKAHAAYLMAVNAQGGRKVQRLIAEKYE